MLKRIKVLNSYAAHARWLADDDTDEPIAWLPRQNIASPYAYSPTHAIYNHWFGDIRKPTFIVETSHRRYEVFEVTDLAALYYDESEAENVYIKSRKVA